MGQIKSNNKAIVIINTMNKQKRVIKRQITKYTYQITTQVQAKC